MTRRPFGRAWRSLGTAALALAGAAGCGLHAVDETPELPTALPEAFVAAPSADQESAGITTPDRWWEAFGDPTLDRLIGQALDDNLDLARAWTRLAQLRAVERGAEAAYLPQISAEAGVARSRNVFFVGEPIGRIENINNQLSLGVGASYELDVWGRVSATESAVETDVAATRQDIEALAMTLTGEVADTYLAIVGERALLDLLAAQEEVSAKLVELVELRFGQGLTSGALEVYQQRQQLTALQAQRPQVEARLAVLEHRLALALGKTPGSVDLGDVRTLPALPPPPELGMPSELLGKRPDVRAALLRIVAADHRVGAAIASRYPALSLSARTGFQAFEIESFFDSWVWSLAANVVAPIFDGGRRSAEVDRAKAAMEELVHGYGQVVLNAFVEVHSALVQQAQQRAHLGKLDAQLEIAQTSLDEAQLRYTHGLATYLNVLTALNGLQRAQQAKLAAERQLLSYRVQLYRALGGSWTADLGPGADKASAPGSDDR